MKAYIDIPKKQKSISNTENGAILAALCTLPLDWKRAADTEIEKLQLLKQLKSTIAEAKSVIRKNQYGNMMSLHDIGAFSLFQVYSRRGYWRIELVLPTKTLFGS
jgi:hypothetical protein